MSKRVSGDNFYLRLINTKQDPFQISFSLNKP